MVTFTCMYTAGSVLCSVAVKTTFSFHFKTFAYFPASNSVSLSRETVFWWHVTYVHGIKLINEFNKMY